MRGPNRPVFIRTRIARQINILRMRVARRSVKRRIVPGAPPHVLPATGMVRAIRWVSSGTTIIVAVSVAYPVIIFFFLPNLKSCELTVNTIYLRSAVTAGFFEYHKHNNTTYYYRIFLVYE